MSHEPSHRRPPRQERWPNATPAEGLLAYQPGEAGQPRRPAEAGQGYLGWERPGDPAGSRGWAEPGGWEGAGVRTDPAVRTGAGGWDSSDGSVGSGGWPNAGRWAGYAQPGQMLSGSAGYPSRHEDAGLRSGAASMLVAPDMLGEWWREAGRPDRGGRNAGSAGVIIGAVSGVLSAAVAMGVGTLAAAFVRPQAAPASVLRATVLARIPAALKVMAAAHLGGHGGTVLLLGVIGVIAIAVGCAAWRNVSFGVACLAAAGLLAAFAAITRPGSRLIDVIPLAAGGAAGIMALLCLTRAAAPVSSSRDAGGSRRRPR